MKQFTTEVRAHEDDRTVEFIASTSTVDRHGTVVNQHGWNLDNFNRNGIVGYQHNVYGAGCNDPNPDMVIGKGHAYIEPVTRDGNTEQQLILRVEFEPAEINELAEKIYKKVEFGSLKTTSVGFSEIGEGEFGRVNEQGEKVNQDIYYFKGQELLEVSIVNIPSNPDALKRGLMDSTKMALKWLEDTFGKVEDLEEYTIKDILSGLESGSLKRQVQDVAQDENIDQAKQIIEQHKRQRTIRLAELAKY